jgi:hypothetical protein
MMCCISLARVLLCWMCLSYGIAKTLLSLHFLHSHNTQALTYGLCIKAGLRPGLGDPYCVHHGQLETITKEVLHKCRVLCFFTAVFSPPLRCCGWPLPCCAALCMWHCGSNVHDRTS